MKSSPINMADYTSSVLARIGEGARLFVKLGQRHVTAREYQGNVYVIPGHAASPTVFTAASYSFDGDRQARLSLRGVGGYWCAVPGVISGMANPILLDTWPGEFVLTDHGNGMVSIQEGCAAGAAYVRVVAERFPHLACGFDAPVLGQFEICPVDDETPVRRW